MAFGACDACGCAYHECECADRKSTDAIHVPAPKETTMTRAIENFNEHGTYIHDFTCFDLVKKLMPQEAFDLMKDSKWITGEKPTSWKKFDRKHNVSDDPARPEAYFILNKGWAITTVNREKGYVEAVYCHDGRYSLYRSGIQAFITRIHGTISWNGTLRRIYESLTEPHEHA